MTTAEDLHRILEECKKELAETLELENEQHKFLLSITTKLVDLEYTLKKLEGEYGINNMQGRNMGVDKIVPW